MGKKGTEVAVIFSSPVKKGDKVFLIRERKWKNPR